MLLRATIHVFMTGCLLPENPETERKLCPLLFNKYKMSWLPAIQKVSQQKSGMEWNAWLRPLISSLDLGQQACPFHSISFLFFAHINNIPVVGLSFDLLVKKLKFYGLPRTSWLGQQVRLSIRRERTMKWARLQSAVLAIFGRSSSGSFDIDKLCRLLGYFRRNKWRSRTVRLRFSLAKSKAMSWQKL